MSDKSAGIDFDRQALVQSDRSAAGAAGPDIARAAGVIFVMAIIGLAGFLAYKLLPSALGTPETSDDRELANIDRRLAEMETRLERLESNRRAIAPATSPRKEEITPQPQPTQVKPPVRTIYQISSTSPQPVRTVPVPASNPDSSVSEPLPALQQGLATLQTDSAANREAWQATTDRLADMAGQVGTQNVQILQNQDELNQMLSRTEMEAIPFELLRGSNPQPVGPVSLVLKSSNPKTQRYTVCVFTQPPCIELKDHTLHEVVQFVVARNTTPLEFIATKILKDELLGYLEVPRDQMTH